MKLILAFLLAVSLAACGQSSPSVPSPETAASAPSVTGKGAGGGGW